MSAFQFHVLFMVWLGLDTETEVSLQRAIGFALTTCFCVVLTPSRTVVSGFAASCKNIQWLHAYIC